MRREIGDDIHYVTILWHLKLRSTIPKLKLG